MSRKCALQRFPQLHFEVAGDGEQRVELGRLHADLGLGDRFVLRGSVADVAGFLRSIDVAVLPSHSEGMSNALLEYMAAGRAVIATDVGANSQLVRHAKDGLIVAPKRRSRARGSHRRVVGEPASRRGLRRIGSQARRSRIQPRRDEKAVRGVLPPVGGVIRSSSVDRDEWKISAILRLLRKNAPVSGCTCP